MNSRRAALILLILGLLILGMGFSYLYAGTEEFTARQFIIDLYANGGAEILSISLTVLIIETLNDRRSLEAEKRDLILQMGSPDNSFAVEAVRLLKQRGWLTDGSLCGADLRRANLQGADLRKVNLREAILLHANLQDTNLREANLQGANLYKARLENAILWQTELQNTRMESCIMPDGIKWSDNYEARFTDIKHPNFWMPSRDKLPSSDIEGSI